MKVGLETKFEHFKTKSKHFFKRIQDLKQTRTTEMHNIIANPNGFMSKTMTFKSVFKPCTFVIEIYVNFFIIIIIISTVLTKFSTDISIPEHQIPEIYGACELHSSVY